MGKKRKRRDDTGNNGYPAKEQNTEPPLPEGVFHYDYLSEVPWDYQNYWRQRHQIFSRYDEGVWMTDESWYSVTPECIATKIAIDMAEGVPDGRSIMVDAFCGAGGNTIAFALSGKWKRVYAIEKDPATLECAKHNAKVYGVHDLITWFLGDCFEILAVDEEKNAERGRGPTGSHWRVWRALCKPAMGWPQV